MKPVYKNVPFPHGYDIAERFHNKEGEPVLLRHAWFAYFDTAILHMSSLEEKFPGISRDRRIIDCSSGDICPWRGLTGLGENVLSFEEWASFADCEKTES